MPTRRVAHQDLQDERRKITRAGNKIIATRPAGDMYEIDYERTEEPPLEIRVPDIAGGDL